MKWDTFCRANCTSSSVSRDHDFFPFSLSNFVLFKCCSKNVDAVTVALQFANVISFYSNIYSFAVSPCILLRIKVFRWMIHFIYADFVFIALAPCYSAVAISPLTSTDLLNSMTHK